MRRFRPTSAVTRTLEQHYNLEHGLHQLAALAASSLVGTSCKTVDLSAYAGVRAVALLDYEHRRPHERDRLETGDLVLVRGDSHEVDRLAADLRLEVR